MLSINSIYEFGRLLTQLPANTADALLQPADREALSWACCTDGLQPPEHLLELLVGETIGGLGCIATHPALAGLHYELVH